MNQKKSNPVISHRLATNLEREYIIGKRVECFLLEEGYKKNSAAYVKDLISYYELFEDSGILITEANVPDGQTISFATFLGIFGKDSFSLGKKGNHLTINHEAPKVYIFNLEKNIFTEAFETSPYTGTIEYDPTRKKTFAEPD